HGSIRTGELSREQDAPPIGTYAEGGGLRLRRCGPNQRELLALIAPGLHAEPILKPSWRTHGLLDRQRRRARVRNAICRRAAVWVRNRRRDRHQQVSFPYRFVQLLAPAEQVVSGIEKCEVTQPPLDVLVQLLQRIALIVCQCL